MLVLWTYDSDLEIESDVNEIFNGVWWGLLLKLLDSPRTSRIKMPSLPQKALFRPSNKNFRNGIKTRNFHIISSAFEYSLANKICISARKINNFIFPLANNNQMFD